MPRYFHTPADITRHLDGLGLFHVELGLRRVRRALDAVGLARPPFAVAQVLGTNGKGSTSAFLAALGQAHGCRVGLYTSPHFVSPAERIAIGLPGGPPSPWPVGRWVEPANAIMEAAPDLTYFEFLTVLALLAFQAEKVDLAVLEAGLGGKSDATTAVAADVCCFAPIALDHRDILGRTLAAIAADKAAAVRSAAPICSAAQFPEAAGILAAAARAHRAELILAPAVDAALPLGLTGPHQRRNASVALAAWRRLAPRLGKDAEDAAAQARGLAAAFLPGRLQTIPGTDAHPALLLDGAHNPHGMQSLAAALAEQGCHPAGAIYGCLADKDWRPAMRRLKRLLGDAPAYVLTLDNPRAARAEDVAAAWNGFPKATACALPSGPDALPQALERAKAFPGAGPGRPVLVTGSLYLLAAFFTRHPHWLAPPPERAARNATSSRKQP